MEWLFLYIHIFFQSCTSNKSIKVAIGNKEHIKEWLTALFAIIICSKFNDGRVHFRNSGVKCSTERKLKLSQNKTETIFMYIIYFMLLNFTKGLLMISTSCRILNRQLFEIFFHFSQETGFDISCKLSPLAWNVKFCFLGKIRKIFQYVACWKFYPEC